MDATRARSPKSLRVLKSGRALLRPPITFDLWTRNLLDRAFSVVWFGFSTYYIQPFDIIFRLSFGFGPNLLTESAWRVDGGLTNQAAPQQADQDRGLKDVAVECARQHDEEELPLCHGALRRMSVMARFAELGLLTLPGWVGVREPRGRLGGRYAKNVTICPTQACTTPACSATGFSATGWGW